MTPRLQLFFQRQEVLDDSVVDDYDAPAAVAVRMSVRIGRQAVGGPAGVPDSHGAMQQTGPTGDLRQLSELARGLAHFDVTIVQHRDPSGVVAAILKTAQPIQQNGQRAAMPYVAHDAAHP